MGRKPLFPPQNTAPTPPVDTTETQPDPVEAEEAETAEVTEDADPVEAESPAAPPPNGDVTLTFAEFAELKAKAGQPANKAAIGGVVPAKVTLTAAQYAALVELGKGK